MNSTFIELPHKASHEVQEKKENPQQTGQGQWTMTWTKQKRISA